MSLRNAYELSDEIKRDVETLTQCLEDYNPGRRSDLIQLVPLSALSFDAAVMSSKLDNLRSIISEESLKEN